MSDLVWLIPDAALAPPALTGNTDTAGTPLVQLNHVTLGLNELPWQWRDKPYMLAIFTVFLARYNALEQSYQDLLLLRSIDTANADDPTGTTGAQLDQLGSKVGQPRNGLTNTNYRRYIRARIATNNSNGRFEDLILIAKLIINNPAAVIEVRTSTVATVIVRIFGISVDNALAGILIEFLRVAVAGGVRLILESNPATVPPATNNRFTLGDAAVPSSNGFTGLGDSGEANQPTLTPYGTTGATGGHLSDARE